MCGVVEDGVVPGLFGYEAGQSAVGDIFAWFVERSVPPEYHERGAATRRGRARTCSRRRRPRSGPARAACSRSTGGTATAPCSSTPICSGLLVGMTLATRPPEIYRALIEATAFGTRVIIDAFETAGVPVDGIVACGGLPERNELLMQIYADVTGREFSVAASAQTPALGAAMFGAVAAGAERRRLRLDRRRVARGWRTSRRAAYRAERRPPRRLRRRSTASTSASTTSSAAAATT